MAGLPALAGNDAAACLQLVEPTPGIEGQDLGRAIGLGLQQGLPLVLGEFPGRAMPAGSELSHGPGVRQGRQRRKLTGFPLPLKKRWRHGSECWGSA